MLIQRAPIQIYYLTAISINRGFSSLLCGLRSLRNSRIVPPSKYIYPCRYINLVHNFFLSIFVFVNLYMFRAAMGPSSADTTVFMQHLVLVILYGWLSGMQGGTNVLFHLAYHVWRVPPSKNSHNWKPLKVKHSYYNRNCYHGSTDTNLKPALTPHINSNKKAIFAAHNLHSKLPMCMKQNRNKCLFKLNNLFINNALFNTEEHKLLNEYWFPMVCNMQLGQCNQ